MTTRIKLNNENAFSMIQDQLTDLIIDNQNLSKLDLLDRLELSFREDLEHDEIVFIFDKIDEIRDCYSLDSNDDYLFTDCVSNHRALFRRASISKKTDKH